MKEKTKVYLLTEEELERFDQMLTALGQAYWALVTQRAIRVPRVETATTLSPDEERFYQLHLNINDQIDKA